MTGQSRHRDFGRPMPPGPRFPFCVACNVVLEPVKHMRVRSLARRGFISIVGAAAAWPLAGHAQQPERVRRVGALLVFAENDPQGQPRVTAFAQALGRFGWVEGKNIRSDYRFAAGDPALFKTYAAELVGMSPDVILAGGSPAVVALREQTRTIPIVHT